MSFLSLKLFLEARYENSRLQWKQRTTQSWKQPPFLSPKEASLYRGLIGSANWMITQGRFDIHYAVSSLSRFAMAPRDGHLQAIKRVFGYLK